MRFMLKTGIEFLLTNCHLKANFLIFALVSRLSADNPKRRRF